MLSGINGFLDAIGCTLVYLVLLGSPLPLVVYGLYILMNRRIEDVIRMAETVPTPGVESVRKEPVLVEIKPPALVPKKAA